MGCHAADEDAAGIFVDGDRSTEKSRQQCAERAYRNEPAIIFQQKFRAQICIAALNSSPRLACLEVTFDIVVAQTPSRALGLGAYFAQWFEYFEQGYVFAAFALHERQGIVGRYGIHGEVFLWRGTGKNEHAQQHRSASKEDRILPAVSPAHRQSIRSAAWDKSQSISAASLRRQMPHRAPAAPGRDSSGM